MKVSVLLSVYNAERTVETAIQSVLNQTFSDYEVVVVNDGSTDGTTEILNAYSDARLQVFHRPHNGLVNALNFGIDQCKGTYIARMDADDYAYPERLALQAEFLDKHLEIAAVTGKVEYGGNRETQQGYAYHVDWLNELNTPDAIAMYRFQDSPVANPASMLRASLFAKYGKYEDNDLPEDYEFWLRILHHKEKIHPIPQTVLKWNDLPTRLTRNHLRYSLEAFYKTRAHYLYLWLKEKDRLNDEFLIFGKGKEVKRRVEPLVKLGIQPSYFIDVKRSKATGTIFYKDLEKRPNQLILSYVADRTGKKQIETYLNQKGFAMGTDYWMMA